MGAGARTRGALRTRATPAANFSGKSKRMGACYELAFGGRPSFFGVNYSATIEDREKSLSTEVRIGDVL